MRSRRAIVLLLPSALLATSCSSTSGSAEAAIITSIVALSAAGASRAAGGCYAACPSGTVCAPETGLCVDLPCRGLCGAGERCDPVEEKCVPNVVLPDLSVGREQSSAPDPFEVREAGRRAKKP